MADTAASPAISVVLPLFDAEEHMPLVLPPLRAALDAGAVSEVIVVDDRSNDRGPEMCREAGFDVFTTERNGGPGAARNLGARQARGDVLLFVDSDVVLGPEVLRVVRDVLAPGTDHVAVFGCYDHEPHARTAVSLYKNLLHAHVHERAAGEASTFWAGCGAVRRREFLDVGGFDAERFRRPTIEDIDLGYRLRDAGGRILLDPRMRATHLKRWTLRSMLATDIFCRALPWGRLILDRGGLASELNVSVAERCKALVAGLLVVALLLAPFLPPAGFVALALAVVAWTSNRSLFGLIWRRAGTWPALVAFVLHQAYYLYATTVFVYCRIERLWRAEPTPPPAPTTTSRSGA